MPVVFFCGFTTEAHLLLESIFISAEYIYG